MTPAVLVPLVTPLGPDGAVVADDVRRLVESVGEHAAGLLPALSTGEGWLLSAEQWEDMVSATVAHAGGLPVYAGVELATTAAVAQRAARAAELGVDGIVATTPFDPGLDGEAAVGHFAAILRHAGVPLLIYNESALSGNVCDLATLVACCALPGVVGIKESSSAPALADELAAAGVGVPVYQGWEHLLRPGPAGCAVGLANLEPAWCAEALTDPSPSARRRVDAACSEYRLLDDDWYRNLKEELVRRRILGSSRTAAPGEEEAHDRDHDRRRPASAVRPEPEPADH